MLYTFGDCTLDTQLYTLQRAGQALRLRPKVFQMLHYLLQHCDRVIPKHELAEHVWRDYFISDATLESTLRGVRQALGDTGRTQHLIQTLPGHGYRLVVDVAVYPDPAPSTMTAPDALAVGRPPAMPAVSAGAAEAPSLLPPVGSVAGERKLVTVLCGAVGPATPGRAPLAARPQTLATAAQPIVAQYGGTLLPVVDETLLAVFGLPVAHEDHAQRAVLAALSLQQALGAPAAGASPGAPGLVRLGVHTGAVAVGDRAEGEALATVVLGELLTQAVVLQARAAPGTILCSATAAHLVRGLVRLAAVAGAPSPGAVYQVRGLRPARVPGGQGRPRSVSPFVGRAHELATLHALVAQAEAGQGQVVGIVGEPGLGKSRLVAEFRRTLRRRRLIYLAGHCLAYNQATPYGPVLELLRQACGIVAADAPATIATKVRQQLAAVGLAPEDGAPYVLSLLGAVPAADLLAYQSPQAVRARTIALLAQLALQGARQQPLVLAVENLHWCDPSSAEVLVALVERLAGTALVLLTTYRPGYRPPWLEKSYATQVALTRLAPADSRRIVQAVLESTPVAEALVPAIIAKAGGNPLFIEELARAVVEAGAAQLSEAVPATIEAVLAARLDRLPPAAKRVVQVAAVMGPEVAEPLLQAVLGWPDVAVRENLAQLQATEFLYETRFVPEPVYTFKHVLTQEAAYQALLPRTRQALHAQIAQVLEARFPETVETQPELLARHYTEAGVPALAVPAWLRAGQRASERSAHIEAITHLTRGLEVLTTLPETPERPHLELILQTTLGPALMATRGYAAPEVAYAYARARELCRQVGDTPQLFQALWGLWYFYLVRAELQTARELGEQLLHLAQRVQAPALLLVAHRVLGQTLAFLGEFSTAHAHLERGMTLYDLEQHRAFASLYGQDQGVICRSWAALTLWSLGYPDQALRRSREGLTLAQELGHPLSLAYAMCFAGMLCQLCRDVQAAPERATAAMALCTEQGFALYLARGTILRGWAMAEQGQGAAGLAEMRRGLVAYQATGAAVFRPYYLAFLAEACGKVGQAGEGLTLLGEALAAVHKTGERFYEAEIYRLKGELLLVRSAENHGEAEACFHQALLVARHQQAKSAELRAAMSLSQLWQQQGKRTEARQLLAEVYSWFTEGFDTADLLEAEALIEAFA